MQLGCKYIFKKLRKIQQHVTSVLIWNIHLKILNQEIVLNSFWLLLFNFMQKAFNLKAFQAGTFTIYLSQSGHRSEYFFHFLSLIASRIQEIESQLQYFHTLFFFAHPLQDWIENSFFSAWILQYREYLQTKEFNFKILIFFVVLVIFRIVRAEYFIRSKRDRGVWKNIIYDEAKLV